MPPLRKYFISSSSLLFHPREHSYAFQPMLKLSQEAINCPDQSCTGKSCMGKWKFHCKLLAVSAVLFLQGENKGCVPTEQAAGSVQGAFTGFIRVQQQSHIKLTCLQIAFWILSSQRIVLSSSRYLPRSKIQKVTGIYIV